MNNKVYFTIYFNFTVQDYMTFNFHDKGNKGSDYGYQQPSYGYQQPNYYYEEEESLGKKIAKGFEKAKREIEKFNDNAKKSFQRFNDKAAQTFKDMCKYCLVYSKNF